MIPRYDDAGLFHSLELRVNAPFPAESLGPEPLGSKRKFWALLEGEERQWLFKFARAGSGEHWAEKLGSEVARLLSLPAARVELATLDGQHGVLVESIVPHEWNPGLNQPVRLGEMIHGNEVLAGYIEHYDRTKLRGQTEHTYANIMRALKKAVPEDSYVDVMTRFAGLLVLDALIGNTDRHHENWALLRLWKGGGSIELAPSYDHASSLGRELQDDRRKELLVSGVDAYVRRGRGAIFGKSTGRHADNPLELVRWAAKQDPSWFHPWLDRAREISLVQIEDILQQMPESVISGTAKDLCRAFLCYTLDALKGM